MIARIDSVILILTSTCDAIKDTPMESSCKDPQVGECDDLILMANMLNSELFSHPYEVGLNATLYLELSLANVTIAFEQCLAVTTSKSIFFTSKTCSSKRKILKKNFKSSIFN